MCILLMKLPCSVRHADRHSGEVIFRITKARLWSEESSCAPNESLRWRVPDKITSISDAAESEREKHVYLIDAKHHTMHRYW